MAYTPPTVDDFAAAFPEFDEIVDADAASAALTLAARFVDETWIEDDYATAILYLAAHFASVGLANAQSAGQEKIEAISIGPLSIKYGKQISSTDLLSSNYGGVYLSLRRRSHPPIAVV